MRPPSVHGGRKHGQVRGVSHTRRLRSSALIPIGSVIMFMRPDFTSAILFLCELFFWLKDNVWLQRMCALLKLLAERVPAIMPGCVKC